MSMSEQKKVGALVSRKPLWYRNANDTEKATKVRKKLADLEESKDLDFIHSDVWDLE